MSRRKAVAFFLGDVGFLSDPKFRKLARRLPDPDAFNSAVGAYWIALAASRRNGSSALDTLAETDSSYLDDLAAVGLLTSEGFPESAWAEWAPQTPQMIAGRARAESAKRNDAGRFTSALDTLGKLDQPSPPLPSTQLLEEGGPGEETPRWLAAWLSVRLKMPTKRQQDVIDAYLRTFDVSGPDRAARVILSKPDDPMGALLADLDAFRGSARLDAEKAEAASAQRHRDQRRGLRKGSVAYDLAQELYRRQEARA